MTYSFPADIQDAIRNRMVAGRYSSEDDLLRDALRALSDEEEDLEAVRAAIAEWRAGDQGRPLAQVFDEIRRAAAGAGGA